MVKILRKFYFLPFFLFLIFSCKKEPIKQLSQKENLNDKGIEKIVEQGKIGALSNVKFSSDFDNWLNNNGYGSYNFIRNDIAGGSFGGKTSASQIIKKQPVVFIHGNGDKAIGSVFGQNGWVKSVNYFKSKGYTNAELYGTTWGDAIMANAAQKYHSKSYLLYIRKFLEAVIAYTGAEKIDIITHSMGVTLSRKAIKGGLGFDDLTNETFDLGAPLSNKIDAFVGIAGANKGLTSCYLSGGTTSTCNKVNGFYPGYSSSNGLSLFLSELNQTSHFEGDYVYSIWSIVDEIICCACLVYGQNTCRINGQNGEKSFATYPYGHFGLKDYTTATQFKMVVNHQTN